MTKIKIQSKMKALNLNGQGLVALLLFVFTSCDKLLPPSGSGSGKLVPVRIRSVSVKGYGDASATRSTGGEKRIVGEPVSLSFGDGTLAEITVEEDVSALRASDPLDNDVLFRVIAVDGNGKVYSYGDYKVEDEALVLTNNTNLHVLKDVSYDYIFISFNNSTLPPAPEEGKALPATITVTAGANDLLYKRLTSQNVTVVDNIPVLKFNDLTHQLARVKLVLDANTGRTITNVAAGSIALNAASSFSFNLTDGEISDPSGTTNFSGWGTFGQQKVTSNTSTFLESAAAYTFSFAENAVTLSENSTEKSTTAGSVTSDKFAFKAESSYTVTLRILKKTSNKFAGSNIYWDDSDQDTSKHKLTFKPYNESNTTPNPETYYQGVSLKWGSLIGISPARLSSSTNFNSGTTTNNGQDDGTPIYLRVNGNWVKTNVAYAANQGWIDAAIWDSIPSYYNVSITSPVGDDAHSLLAKSDFEHYKGDICNYINSAYRMPTRNELVALYNSNASSYYTGFTSSNITNQAADGMTAFTAQYGTFKGISGTDYHLPASGYRNNSSGSLYSVGGYGCYWSGSATSGTDNAYYLYFGGSGDANADVTGRSYGFPVRCVKIE